MSALGRVWAATKGYRGYWAMVTVLFLIPCWVVAWPCPPGFSCNDISFGNSKCDHGFCEYFSGSNCRQLTGGGCVSEYSSGCPSACTCQYNFTESRWELRCNDCPLQSGDCVCNSFWSGVVCTDPNS